MAMLTCAPSVHSSFSVGLSVESRPTSSTFVWQGSVDVYHNRVLDRILGIPANQTVWRTTNLYRVRAVGVDLSGHIWAKCASRHTLELSGNASFQRVTDESQRGAATYGLQLPYIPELTAHLALVWSNPWCDFFAH